jgi:uncharacterized protein YbbC (DUF1343 family)
MTAGELALMTSSSGWISRVPQLNVAKMQGWSRSMTWQDTGLRWYRTSPNIPHATSPLYYVASGILGGAALVDIGIGTENPFGYAGALGVNPQAMYTACCSFGMKGVSFTPYSKNGFGGVRLSIHPRAQADLTALDVLMLDTLNRLSRGRVLGKMSGDKLNLFHKVYGSESLYTKLREAVPASRIVSGWSAFTHSFRSSRQRHLLYA